jgi:hypothetical protein
VRKTIFLFSLVFALRLAAAENLTMTDGSTFAGDIVKFDDNGILLRATGDVYTNLSWGRFSQASLKQLTDNPKIKLLVEPFIEPDATARPPKAEIQVNPVKRLERPDNPSLFGGLVKSPVGLVILLAIYLANLYAAYEVSMIRARPALQVIGLAAILPVAGPVIFLIMPIRMESPVDLKEDAGLATAPGVDKPQEEIQIIEASWKQDEKKKNEPQVFARGKFTFNKRFIETKFAGYFGTPKGDAVKNVMELKTPKGQFTVERIAQIGATEAIFETKQSGQVTVPFTDILEIALVPKPE